jgi:tetratricopeptide (TPR) repeat protein
MKLLISFLFFLFFLVQTSFSQSKEIDSLLVALKKLPEDTVKVNILNALAQTYINIADMEKAREYAVIALELAQKLEFKKGIGDSWNNLGTVYLHQAKHESSLNYYLEALSIRKEIGDKKGIGDSYNGIGNVYSNQTKFVEALNYLLESLKVRLEIGDQKGISGSYNNLGNVYKSLGKYVEAANYYLKSFKIKDQTGDKKGMATTCVNLGDLYFNQNRDTEALHYYLKSLRLREEIGDKRGIAACYNFIGALYERQGKYADALNYEFKAGSLSEKIGDKRLTLIAYNNIGLIYEHQGQFPAALDYYFKALKIAEKIGHKRGMLESYNGIGNIYEKQGSYTNAISSYTKALSTAKEIEYKKGIEDTYEHLSSVHRMLQDYKKALVYYKQYREIKDTLLNKESSLQIAEMQNQYETEKKEHEIKLLNKEKNIKDLELSKRLSELNKQRVISVASIGGVLLLLVLTLLLFNRYNLRQKANEELYMAYNKIEEKNRIFESLNTQITDSIYYARGIQNAVLPDESEIMKYLPDSFVLFEPKEIVSGAFYWFSATNEKLFIVAADCAVHGVPGALMSIIGNTLLNEIINERKIYEPDQILNFLNKNITGLLYEKNVVQAEDKRMSMSVCVIDKNNSKIQFAGANLPVYLLHNSKIQSIKSDHYSIGGMTGKEEKKFNIHYLEIEKGTILYLSSNGFNKQLMEFEEMLLSIQQSDMQQQKKELMNRLSAWKENNKQMEDILVIGIKFG